MSCSILTLPAAHSFLLLFLLSTAVGAQDYEPVLDHEGNAVRVGVPYNIMLAQYPPGVITLANGSSINSCPLNVVQKLWNLPFPPRPTPLPTTFYPSIIKDDDDVIRVSTMVNIRFEVATDCPESTVWRVVNLNGSTREGNFVITGGEIGNPGCDTVENWFKIQAVAPSAYVYKLVFNPEVCGSGEDSDIIAVDENGQSRLYVNIEGRKADLMMVRFVKAENTLLPYQVQ